MPIGPGEPGFNESPFDDALVTKRPSIPTYLTNDENLQPDLIIEVENPHVVGYIQGANAGANYIEGAKLTYLCWQANKDNTANKWKIKLIHEFKLNDTYGQKNIRVFYPYGADSYNFNPDHVRSYIWGEKY